MSTNKNEGTLMSASDNKRQNFSKKGEQTQINGRKESKEVFEGCCETVCEPKAKMI